MNDFLEEFNNYKDFVAYMEAVANNYSNLKNRPSVNCKEVDMFLNGVNSKAISKFLCGRLRKEQGIFFTDEKLANKIAFKIKKELRAGKTIYDPACGAGDLLLACTQYMPLKGSFSETSRFWSDRIYGQDIFKDFIRSARSRILLSCSNKSIVNSSDFDTSFYFKNIIEKNFFEENHIKKADCIVTNPPFGYVDLTGKVEWGSGRGQLAALFVDNLIESGRDGQRLVAILPDVLRSGSRYSKWRGYVNKNSIKLKSEIFGKFNDEADVDVFILDLTIKKNNQKKEKISFNVSQSCVVDSSKVSDYFNVSVGPVVPHRDTEEGSLVPYLDTSNAVIKTEIVVSKKSRYECTMKKPPFVVIRRTSGPNDFPRLKCTIVKGNESVAVENHLIVLEPIDGKLKTCRSFMEFSCGDGVTELINKKIRCRHLTVGAVKEIPWKSKK